VPTPGSLATGPAWAPSPAGLLLAESAPAGYCSREQTPNRALDALSVRKTCAVASSRGVGRALPLVALSPLLNEGSAAEMPLYSRCLSPGLGEGSGRCGSGALGTVLFCKNNACNDLLLPPCAGIARKPAAKAVCRELRAMKSETETEKRTLGSIRNKSLPPCPAENGH